MIVGCEQNKNEQYPSTPDALYRGSLNFYNSAETIFCSDRKVHYDVFGFLLSHSLELTLKSFLLNHDLDEEFIRKKLGHSLVKSWKKSSSLGLKIDSKAPTWCETLNSAHDLPYHFRYAKVNTGLVLPPAQQTLDDLKSVLMLVGNDLGMNMEGNFV